ncbi:hypothetical protein HOK51_06300 [Candidatus Woesearchaeota archaeon]|jgi:hypothetical protein|nr:hypothetical protein [Candidatus Woesearchaeota archaeon]MBT6519437.1 hypothetical protein [Candidatus Woesearchaeota archaeon]MBT7368902.1 hypothetical protein [Candidatus Woesearchaeota archaeon]
MVKENLIYHGVIHKPKGNKNYVAEVNFKQGIIGEGPTWQAAKTAACKSLKEVIDENLEIGEPIPKARPLMTMDDVAKHFFGNFPKNKELSKQGSERYTFTPTNQRVIVDFYKVESTKNNSKSFVFGIY